MAELLGGLSCDVDDDWRAVSSYTNPDRPISNKHVRSPSAVVSGGQVPQQTMVLQVVRPRRCVTLQTVEMLWFVPIYPCVCKSNRCCSVQGRECLRASLSDGCGAHRLLTRGCVRGGVRNERPNQFSLCRNLQCLGVCGQMNDAILLVQ